MQVLNENELQLIEGGQSSAICNAGGYFLIGVGGLAGSLVGGPFGGVLGAGAMAALWDAYGC